MAPHPHRQEALLHPPPCSIRDNPLPRPEAGRVVDGWPPSRTADAFSWSTARSHPGKSRRQGRSPRPPRKNHLEIAKKPRISGTEYKPPERGPHRPREVSVPARAFRTLPKPSRAGGAHPSGAALVTRIHQAQPGDTMKPSAYLASCSLPLWHRRSASPPQDSLPRPAANDRPAGHGPLREPAAARTKVMHPPVRMQPCDHISAARALTQGP